MRGQGKELISSSGGRKGEKGREESLEVFDGLEGVRGERRYGRRERDWGWREGAKEEERGNNKSVQGEWDGSGRALQKDGVRRE